MSLCHRVMMIMSSSGNDFSKQSLFKVTTQERNEYKKEREMFARMFYMSDKSLQSDFGNLT